MKQLIVQSIKLLNSCRIIIGENALLQLDRITGAGTYSKIFVVTDKCVASLHMNKLLKVLSRHPETIILPPGEESKEMKTVERIWNRLLDSGADRKSVVINFGGGVVSDTGGFAAATFMRGIDFINIPTTLLSQVDASIGGKSGVNFHSVKNIIGSFSQPSAIIIDPVFLSTLSGRDLASGLSEIMKHGLIADRNLFIRATEKRAEAFNTPQLSRFILNSCRIKASIVANDPEETGLRKILNFGHTAGHALESISMHSNNPLTHGEAVKIGMLIESKISRLVGLLSGTEYKLIEEKLRSADICRLPENFRESEFLRLVGRDKKNSAGTVRWTLLTSIGKACFDIEIPEKIVLQAMKETVYD